MTSHYFVKWQQPIVNKSGTASTTATGIGTGTCTATGTNYSYYCTVLGCKKHLTLTSSWLTLV